VYREETPFSDPPVPGKGSTIKTNRQGGASQVFGSYCSQTKGAMGWVLAEQDWQPDGFTAIFRSNCAKSPASQTHR
jgi:hypothetical protein